MGRAAAATAAVRSTIARALRTPAWRLYASESVARPDLNVRAGRVETRAVDAVVHVAQILAEDG